MAPVNLTAARLDRGLSVREAANQIGVGAGSLRKAEAGGQVIPKVAFKIANFYGYQVTEIWPVESGAAA